MALLVLVRLQAIQTLTSNTVQSSAARLHLRAGGLSENMEGLILQGLMMDHVLLLSNERRASQTGW